MKTTTAQLLAALLLAMAALGSSVLGADEGAQLKPCSNEALILSQVDYSDMNNWLRFSAGQNGTVDVFAVYPTVASSQEEADRPYMRLESGLMREQAAAWLAEVEGVFPENANVYAPLYRQWNGVELAALKGGDFSVATNATPRDDAFAAFEYYLTAVNKGERPFILFGHSQGAQLVMELATTLLGNEKYCRHNTRHRITYAIGCSVTPGQMAKNPNLEFSKSPDDVGVIVSWNTTAPSEVESGAYKRFGTWKAGALVTNPISWRTDETPAPAPAGARGGAVVDNARNVLVATGLDESQYQSPIEAIGKFHAFDIQFYYDSIKRNMQERLK